MLSSHRMLSHINELGRTSHPISTEISAWPPHIAPLRRPICPCSDQTNKLMKQWHTIFFITVSSGWSSNWISTTRGRQTRYRRDRRYRAAKTCPCRQRKRERKKKEKKRKKERKKERKLIYGVQVTTFWLAVPCSKKVCRPLSTTKPDTTNTQKSNDGCPVTAGSVE